MVYEKRKHVPPKGILALKRAEEMDRKRSKDSHDFRESVGETDSHGVFKDNNVFKMREIKFRVWDKEFGGWLENVTLYQYGNVASEGVFVPRKDIEIMQYTGLKDKNGKEIYEGDIIRFKTFSGTEMVYTVSWSEHKAKFYPTRMTDRNSIEINIIGNIYESPELLK